MKDASSIATPDEIYQHPASPFVYGFLGEVNLFHGRVHQGRALIEGIELEAPEHKEADGLSAIAYVRPHDIHVDRNTNGGGALAAACTPYPFRGAGGAPGADSGRQ